MPWTPSTGRRSPPPAPAAARPSTPNAGFRSFTTDAFPAYVPDQDPRPAQGGRLSAPLHQAGDPRQPAGPPEERRSPLSRHPGLRPHGDPVGGPRPPRRPRLHPARPAPPGEDPHSP